jgi:hypothetical protein
LFELNATPADIPEWVIQEVTFKDRDDRDYSTFFVDDGCETRTDLVFIIDGSSLRVRATVAALTTSPP